MCLCRKFPRCIYLVYYALVECWACKWFALSLFACVSKCEWALWSLPYSDCLFDHAMVCFLTPSLLDHFIRTLYAFHAFLHTIIMVYCYVLGDSCSYDSRASKFLELGVSELCLTVPNSYVKSRVYFRVLSRNSQRGRL